MPAGAGREIELRKLVDPIYAAAIADTYRRIDHLSRWQVDHTLPASAYQLEAVVAFLDVTSKQCG